MSLKSTTLVSLCLVALAAPVAAQDAAATPGTSSEAAPAAAAPTDGTGDQPKVGDAYVAEEFGDWQIRCFVTEDGHDPCDMYQLLKSAEDNPVAQVSLIPLPPGGDAVGGATIITPLGTLLPPGIKMSVDGSKELSFPFAFCEKMGCASRFGMAEDVIAAFRKGKVASVSIRSVQKPDELVALTMSLDGFTAAWNRIGEIAAQAEASKAK